MTVLHTGLVKSLWISLLPSVWRTEAKSLSFQRIRVTSLLEGVQRRVKKVIRGLEGLMYEERSKGLNLYHLDNWQWTGNMKVCDYWMCINREGSGRDYSGWDDRGNGATLARGKQLLNREISQQWDKLGYLVVSCYKSNYLSYCFLIYWWTHIKSCR